MFSKAKRVERNVSVPSIISADLKVNGDIVSSGEMQIDGHVDGDVKCSRLTVGESGNIKGMVNAEQALVRGRVEGHIEAGAVTLAQTAKVRGDVVHETLTIEPGAHIEGLCRRVSRQANPDDAAVRWSDIKATDAKVEVRPAALKSADAKASERPFDTKAASVKATDVKPAEGKSNEPKLTFGLGTALPKPA